MQFFFFRILEAFFIKVKMEIMCIDEIQIFSERAEVTDLQRLKKSRDFSLLIAQYTPLQLQ